MLATLGPAATPVAAHSTLVAGSPGPGQTVGGEFERIDLAFDDGVEGLTATLVAPDGDVVEAEVTAQAANWVSLDVPGDVWEPGRWTVRYAFVSADGDPIDTFFVFTYEAGAPAPLPVVVPELPERRLSTPAILLVAVLAAVVLGLALRLAARLCRLRSGPARAT